MQISLRSLQYVPLLSAKANIFVWISSSLTIFSGMMEKLVSKDHDR